MCNCELRRRDDLTDPLPEAVDLVIDVARNEAEPSLRARAVALLTAHANHPEVEGILESVAASDPQPALREVAAAALRELR